MGVRNKHGQNEIHMGQKDMISSQMQVLLNEVSHGI